MRTQMKSQRRTRPTLSPALFGLLILSQATLVSGFEPGSELRIVSAEPVVLDTPLRPSERMSFDIITDKPGAQPWEQLRVKVDYADPENHTDIILTSYGSLVVSEVRGGQRKKIYEPQGRGKPQQWQRVDLEATPDGIRLDLGLRRELVIPWRDAAKPVTVAFSAENGAAGRVKLLAHGPAPRSSDGALSLHPLFSDHAVLQHGREVPVTGKASPEAGVTLQLDGKTVGTTNADGQGRWTIKLPPQPPGGPHRLVVESGGSKLDREDILFGEVWFCSGQSNMQWRLRDSDDAEAEALRLAAAGNLRAFHVKLETAEEEQPFPPTPSEWRAPDESSARHLSALAQIFGLELAAQLGKPVGVIISAKGGSRIEPWMSAAARATVEKEVGPYNAEYLGKLGQHESPPGSLFNAMVAPYLDFPLAGVAWYQGESNAWRGWHYRHQLRALISDWRERFGSPKLPFLIVQLPSFGGKKMDHNAPVWAELREAQAQVAADMDGAELVVALDHGDPMNIHPPAKRPVAERMVRSALRHVHGRGDIVADPPRVVKSRAIPGGISVTFDRPVALQPEAVSDFQLAESDQPFATAKEVRQPKSDTLEVMAAAGNPTELRYAWKNVVKAALHGPEGLAVAPFRTDKRPGLSEGLQ